MTLHLGIKMSDMSISHLIITIFVHFTDGILKKRGKRWKNTISNQSRSKDHFTKRYTSSKLGENYLGKTEPKWQTECRNSRWVGFRFHVKIGTWKAGSIADLKQMAVKVKGQRQFQRRENRQSESSEDSFWGRFCNDKWANSVVNCRVCWSWNTAKCCWGRDGSKRVRDSWKNCFLFVTAPGSPVCNHFCCLRHFSQSSNSREHFPT